MFVDDEKCILDALRRSLRDMTKEWDMYFVDSGKDALEIIKSIHMDVIVSDMRMPGMDGAQLLMEVMRISPFTARFILSGQSDREAVLKTVGPAHQFFSKPCDIKKMKDIIRNALALRHCLCNEELTGAISRIESLPCVPQIYLDISNELQKSEVSLERVANLVQADLGFSTKILQIVNSSFFGVPNHISDIRQAVIYLGIDIIKSLVLYVKVFHEFCSKEIPRGWLEDLMDHSLAVAKFAKIIITSGPHDKNDLDNLFTAACFHDVGKLVFFANMGKKYQETCQYMENRHCTETIAEQAIIGITHPEVGAYLIALWGLRDIIVETILFHHNPSHCYYNNYNILPILHFCDCFYYEIHPDKNPHPESSMPLDMEYLEQAGVLESLPAWRALLEKNEGITHG